MGRGDFEVEVLVLLCFSSLTGKLGLQVPGVLLWSLESEIYKKVP